MKQSAEVLLQPVLQQPVEDAGLGSVRSQRDSLETALVLARQQLGAMEDQRKHLLDEISAAKEQIRRDGEDIDIFETEGSGIRCTTS